ncbi:Ribosomal protein S18 acetylase RimI [Blastococcus aurantiacus]|uniref:Ribosomal protein S18 acetylase RimI n=1 Tax=Blastococcus aurantiacus TaxID=1550231 RepID=A0A1G7HEM6_9ACTN|nr:GNAT family N-acetyltransferase [Blastococcus aurantiacus]SDE98828.1 Ribosomal protein S18 acetylase RimI [Blastococcus aurantiacus]
MDAVELRAARPADAEAVEEYHHRCFLSTYAAQVAAGEFGPPERSGTRQQLHDRFLPGSDCETVVAVADGTPIGHVTVSGHRLVHLFVEPGHQGRGLGRRLLARGEAMLTAHGHADLELHARVENLAAIAFYVRQGWTVTGRLIRTVEHGIAYDEWVLVKHCT